MDNLNCTVTAISSKPICGGIEMGVLGLVLLPGQRTIAEQVRATK